MLTGGRVLHHLVQRAPVKENTLLFVGYQAGGTRGAGLVRGEREIRVFGMTVDVQCHVAEIGGFSAHADRSDLLSWIQSAPHKPGRVFLNHGEDEPGALDAIRGALGLMARGELPRMPIVVRGAALARRVLDELPPEAVAQLRIEG